MLYAFSEYSESEHGADAGGKGAVLATLFQQGYPVPDGFIIGADACGDGQLSAALWEDVTTRFEALLGIAGGVAVRSSGVAEDAPDRSFAGEFETVLNVRDAAALKDAVAKVIASAGSERVRVYSNQAVGTARHATMAQDFRMAVVVQAMLAPDYAGVLFTTDPITQDANTLCGSFVEGLAEALVSGETNGHSFTIDRAHGTYAGPGQLAGVSSELIRLALKLEQDLGRPQDIEWAVEDQRVYILQSRPITTLGITPATEVWNSTRDGDFLWTNTNVGEAIGDVMTPYTWSAVRQTFDDLYRPPRGFSMLGNVGGHVYMNVSVLLAAGERLGLSIAKMMALLEPAVGPAPINLTVPKVDMGFIQAGGFVLRIVARLLGVAVERRRFLTWAREQSVGFCDTYLQRIAQLSNRAEALQLGTAVKKDVDRGFGVLILVSNDSMSRQTRLRQALQEDLDHTDVETLISGLGGDGLLHSMGPMVAVERVARGEASREEFIRAYGHRGPDEMELGKPRTAEDPAWIDKLIAQARHGNVGQLLAQQKQARERAWARLDSKVSARRARRLRKMAARAAAKARDRELIRSELVRFANVPRQLALRIGELTELGEDIFFLELDEIEQLLLGDDAQKQKIPARKSARERYRPLPPLPNWISGEIDLDEWATLPGRRTDFFDARHTAADIHAADVAAADLVQGAAGAAGIVEGKVRVLRHHDEADLLQSGEILVTSFTNVGWTPLFPRLAAVVTDVGAPLSHAAIVARELGIPAVVGTGSATMRLQTGDRVRVNGSAGTVERLQ